MGGERNGHKRNGKEREETSEERVMSSEPPRGGKEEGCLRVRGAQVWAQTYPRGLATRWSLEILREQLHSTGRSENTKAEDRMEGEDGSQKAWH